MWSRKIQKIFNRSSTGHNSQSLASKPLEPLHTSLHDNLKTVRTALGDSGDIIIREIRIGTERLIRTAILYIDGLADTNSIHNFIMESLMLNIRGTEIEQKLTSCPNLIDLLKESILTAGNIRDATDFDTLFTSLLSGNTILLLDGYAHGVVISMTDWEDRGVTEPSTQTVVRGPKEGFSENLHTNIALVRRKIKDPNLWWESKQIGRRTKTDIAVMYINGIVNDKVLQEVLCRLDRIDIDGILESGYIEELIQDETYTPFPTIYHSERPDVIAAGLLEGRIAILTDGTPFVLLAPAVFAQYFQSAEDYYQRSDFGILRLLRYLALFLSLLGPSLYIAVTTYHQELIPSTLLFNLAGQREGVPFPAFIEALLMEVTFEILREAGIRMPRTVGQAVSIVGALVIGQAAVEAGIVSGVMVIVVSLTAISNFALPAFNMAISIRILRFGFMGLAASFGIIGITAGFIALVFSSVRPAFLRSPVYDPFCPFYCC